MLRLLIIVSVQILTIVGRFDVISQDPNLQPDTVLTGTTMVIEFPNTTTCNDISIQTVDSNAYCATADLQILLTCDSLCRCTADIPLRLETNSIGLCSPVQQRAIDSRIIIVEPVWESFSLTAAGGNQFYDISIVGKHINIPHDQSFALSLTKDCSILENSFTIPSMGAPSGVYVLRNVKVTLLGIVSLCSSTNDVNWVSHSHYGQLVGPNLIDTYTAVSPYQGVPFEVVFEAGVSSIGELQNYIYSFRFIFEGVVYRYTVPVERSTVATATVEYSIGGALPDAVQVIPCVATSMNGFTLRLDHFFVPDCLPGYDIDLTRNCLPCPGLCSQNGYCISGSCVCYSRHTGPTCSTYILAGVDILGIPSDVATDFSVDILTVDFTIKEYFNHSDVSVSCQLVSQTYQTIVYNVPLVSGDTQQLEIIVSDNIIGDVQVKLYSSKVGDFHDSPVSEATFRIKKKLSPPTITIPDDTMVVGDAMGFLSFIPTQLIGHPMLNPGIYYSISTGPHPSMPQVRFPVVDQLYLRPLDIKPTLESINIEARGSYRISCYAESGSVNDEVRYFTSEEVGMVVTVQEISKRPTIELSGEELPTASLSFVENCTITAVVDGIAISGKMLLSTQLISSADLAVAPPANSKSLTETSLGEHTVYSRFLNTTDQFFLPSEVSSRQFSLYHRRVPCQVDSSAGSVFPVAQYDASSLTSTISEPVLNIRFVSTETDIETTTVLQSPSMPITFSQAGSYLIGCINVPVIGNNFFLNSKEVFSNFIVKQQLPKPVISITDYEEYSTVAAANIGVGLASSSSEIRPREYQSSQQVNISQQGVNIISVYTATLNNSHYVDSENETRSVVVYKKTPRPVITTTGVPHGNRVNSFLQEGEFFVSVLKDGFNIDNGILNVKINNENVSSGRMRIAIQGEHRFFVSALIVQSEFYLESEIVEIVLYVYHKLLPCDISITAMNTDLLSESVIDSAQITMRQHNIISSNDVSMQYTLTDVISGLISPPELYYSDISIGMGKHNISCKVISYSLSMIEEYLLDSDEVFDIVVVKELLPIAKLTTQEIVKNGFYEDIVTITCGYPGLVTECEFIDHASVDVVSSNTIQITTPGPHVITSRLTAMHENDLYLPGPWIEQQFSVQGITTQPAITIDGSTVRIEVIFPLDASVKYSLGGVNSQLESFLLYNNPIQLTLPGLVLVSAIAEQLPYYRPSLTSSAVVSANFDNIISNRFIEAAALRDRVTSTVDFNKSFGGVLDRLSTLFVSLLPATPVTESHKDLFIFPVRFEDDYWTQKRSAIVLCRLPIDEKIERTWSEYDSMYLSLKINGKQAAYWNATKNCFFDESNNCLPVKIGLKNDCLDNSRLVLQTSTSEIYDTISDYADVRKEISNSFSEVNVIKHRFERFLSHVRSLEPIVNGTSYASYQRCKILLENEISIINSILDPIVNVINKFLTTMMKNTMDSSPLFKLVLEIKKLLASESVNVLSVTSKLKPLFLKLFQEGISSNILVAGSSLNVHIIASKLREVVETVSTTVSLIVIVQWILIIHTVSIKQTTDVMTYVSLLDLVETKIQWLSDGSPLLSILDEVEDIRISDLVMVLNSIKTDSNFKKMHSSISCLKSKAIGSYWDLVSITTCLNSITSTQNSLFTYRIPLSDLQYATHPLDDSLTAGLPSIGLFHMNSDNKLVVGDVISPFCLLSESDFILPYQRSNDLLSLATARCLNMNFVLQASPVGQTSDLGVILGNYNEVGFLFGISFSIKIFDGLADVSHQILNFTTPDGNVISIGVQSKRSTKLQHNYQFSFTTVGINIIVSQPVSLEVGKWCYVSILKQSDSLHQQSTGRDNSLLIFVNHVLVAAGFVPSPHAVAQTSVSAPGSLSLGGNFEGSITDIIVSSYPVEASTDTEIFDIIMRSSIPSVVILNDDVTCHSNYYYSEKNCVECPINSLTSTTPRRSVTDCICKEGFIMTKDICVKGQDLNSPIGCPLIEANEGDTFIAYKDSIIISKRYDVSHQIHSVSCQCGDYTWCVPTRNDSHSVEVKFKTISPRDSQCTITVSTDAEGYEKGEPCSIDVLVRYQLPQPILEENIYPRNHSFANLFERIYFSIYDYSVMSFSAVVSARTSSVLQLNTITDIPNSNNIDIRYLNSIWELVIKSLRCRVKQDQKPWQDYHQNSLLINPWSNIQIQIASDYGVASDIMMIKYTNRVFYHVLPVMETDRTRAFDSIPRPEMLLVKSDRPPQVEVAFWICGFVVCFIIVIVMFCIVGEMYKHALAVEQNTKIKKHLSATWIFPTTTDSDNFVQITDADQQQSTCQTCGTPSEYLTSQIRPSFGDVIYICYNCNSLLKS